MSDNSTKPKKPSGVIRFMNHVSNRLRGSSPVKVSSKLNKVQNSTPQESKQSPFRRTLDRLSFTKKHKIKRESSDLVSDEVENNENAVPNQKTKWLTSSPRPAISECDLRHVTIRRGTELQNTPLAGASQFMSEDNLAGSQCGIPLENRVPSYLKISCTLNGYRSPRPAIENTPIRPAGKSLIERRLAQLRGPSELTTQNKSPEISNSLMGATCSSPTVKNLIGQFDRLKLCTDDLDENDLKENLKPVVVTQPTLIQSNPINDNTFLEKSASTSTDKKHATESEPIPNSAASSARSGNEFKDILDSTRKSLEERSKLALTDLENFSNMPEQAADSIRMASGKASLLSKKKLSKFDELVNANMHPDLSDKKTTTEDLEGYWALVEMELTDINNCFKEVEQWRRQNYEGDVSSESISPKSEKNNNGQKKVTQATKPVVAPKPMSEKQKVAAETRKKAIAEARARAKQQKENDDSDGNPGMLII